MSRDPDRNFACGPVAQLGGDLSAERLHKGRIGLVGTPGGDPPVQRMFGHERSGRNHAESGPARQPDQLR